MFIHYGDVAFNLTNSTKIEKKDRRITVHYLPVNEKSNGYCEIYSFDKESECTLAWLEIRQQMHEFNKKTS